MSEDKENKRKSWRMQFLISVLGTSIGVGLTFAVGHMMETKKKEQAQRMTAMMVIHDIDESINTVKEMKDNMEMMYNATVYAKNHIDNLSEVPNDTISMSVGFLLEDDQEFRFDKSKEKIFHSSPDTWQNLGNMKFIDNVQSFYFDRQAFQDMRNTSVVWKEPVPINEAIKINIDYSDMDLNQYMERYNNRLREFLKEKMDDNRIKFFIDYTQGKISYLVLMIESWTQLNNENKFLMSITDEELVNYVNTINNNGIALKDNSLVGIWCASPTDENLSEYEFKKDHTFSFSNVTTRAANIIFSKGNVKIIRNKVGTWALEGDSLVLMGDADGVSVDLDASDMIVQPEKQEMLDDWVNELKVTFTDIYKNDAKDNPKSMWSAHLDGSQNKMELKGKEGAFYFKRK